MTTARADVRMRQAELEVGRLAAVDSYGLVGGARPERLDGLTRIAAAAFDAPMSSVTLVHSDRQWFTGSTGLDEPGTSRAASFSARLIDDPRPLAVADTRDDPLYRFLPHVTQVPPIRFYAGVPLVDADGHVLGSVAVFDRVPRVASEARMELLRGVSVQASAHLQAIRDAELLGRLQVELGRVLEHEASAIADVSHELRTPVAAMLGFLELLAEQPIPAAYWKILGPLSHTGRELIRSFEQIVTVAQNREAT